jgi:hypothetical protein
MSLRNNYRIVFQRPGSDRPTEWVRNGLTPPEAMQAFRDARLTERLAGKSWDFPTGWRLDRHWGAAGWKTVTEA